MRVIQNLFVNKNCVLILSSVFTFLCAANASNLNYASISHLTGIFEFIVTGNLSSVDGLLVKRIADPNNPRVDHVIFGTRELGTLITIAEPAQEIYWNDMTEANLEFREELSLLLFRSVPVESRRAFVSEMLRIIDEAQRTSPFEPKRMHLAASYPLQADLVPMFFETGDPHVLLYFIG